MCRLLGYELLDAAMSDEASEKSYMSEASDTKPDTKPSDTKPSDTKPSDTKPSYNKKPCDTTILIEAPSRAKSRDPNVSRKYDGQARSERCRDRFEDWVKNQYEIGIPLTEASSSSTTVVGSVAMDVEVAGPCDTKPSDTKPDTKPTDTKAGYATPRWHLIASFCRTEQFLHTRAYETRSTATTDFGFPAGSFSELTSKFGVADSGFCAEEAARGRLEEPPLHTIQRRQRRFLKSTSQNEHDGNQSPWLRCSSFEKTKYAKTVQSEKWWPPKTIGELHPHTKAPDTKSSDTMLSYSKASDTKATDTSDTKPDTKHA
jgi:hypothetical protein